MSTDNKTLLSQQAMAFQRFTIRLVNGKFVRVPKSDLPSVEPQTDQTSLSNQTEVRDLFRLVNGRFVHAKTPRPASAPLPPPAPAAPPSSLRHPDPSFDLP